MIDINNIFKIVPYLLGDNKFFVRFIVSFIICGLFLVGDVLSGTDEAAIWVVDNKTSELIKLSADRERDIVITTLAPGYIAIDESDGSLWVNHVCEQNPQVLKLSPEGKILARLSGYDELDDAGVSPLDGTYWVADEGAGYAVKISRDGRELLRVKFDEPEDVKISPVDGSVWVSDKEGYRVVKMTPEGIKLAQKRGVGEPHHLAISPIDGSCWVASETHRKVFKISSDGKKILAKVNEFKYPFGLSIDPRDGSCWVTDQSSGQVIKISPDGKELLVKVEGFRQPRGMSNINPKDGSFWFVDWTAGEIIKLSSHGEILERIGGFNYPYFIQVLWTR